MVADAAAAAAWEVADARWTEDYVWIVVLTAFASLFASFGIGANDVANAFATSVGSGAVTLKQAVYMAAVFEFLGAVLLGASVTKTVRKGIADPECFQDNPALLMHGMFCALLSTGAWLLLATYLKMPVSTTHSIIGSIVGMTVAVAGTGCVTWYKAKEDWPYVGGVGGIVLSWLVAPLLSYGFSALLFTYVKYAIMRSKNSYNRAFYFYPFLVWCTMFTLCLFMIYKGAKNKGWLKVLGETEAEQDGFAALIAMGVATVIIIVTMPFGLPWLHRRITKEFAAKTLETAGGMGTGDAPLELATVLEMGGSETRPKVETKAADPTLPVALGTADFEASKGGEAEEEDHESNESSLSVKMSMFEKMSKDIHTLDEAAKKVHENAETFDERTEMFFRYVQVFTACCNAFAHGANDVANAVGPLAAVWVIYNTHKVDSKSELGDDAYWLLAIGGGGIVLGLALYGYKIIQVLGCEIAKLTPSRGFAVELGAVAVIIMGTRLGIPLSTTHCQVGATCGVAHAEGRHGVNYRSLATVIFGWFLTLIITGCISAVFVSMGAYAPSRWGPAYDGMANPLAEAYELQGSAE